MIRAIQTHEIKLLLPLALKFWEEGRLPGRIVISVFESNWSRLINAGTGRIFAKFEDGKPIGAIGLFVINDINDGERICEEAFWFVDPHHRLFGTKLFKHAIHYAQSSECKRMCMVHLECLAADKIGPFYERNGFHLVERKYLRIF